MEKVFRADRPWGQRYRKRLLSAVFLVSSYQLSQAGPDRGVLAHNFWMKLGQMQQSSEKLYLFLPNFSLQIKCECCGLGYPLSTADYLKQTVLSCTSLQKKGFFSRRRNCNPLKLRSSARSSIQGASYPAGLDYRRWDTVILVPFASAQFHHTDLPTLLNLARVTTWKKV